MSGPHQSAVTHPTQAFSLHTHAAVVMWKPLNSRFRDVLLLINKKT